MMLIVGLGYPMYKTSRMDGGLRVIGKERFQKLFSLLVFILVGSYYVLFRE